VVQGPNLNLLGQREPEIYGSQSLEDLHQNLQTIAHTLQVDLSFFQSNHEGALIDHLHTLRSKVQGVIINAAGLTHTSVSLRDALIAIELPFVEVHLSNIYRRESFRHYSYLSDVAEGICAGFGPHSYELALRGLTLTLQAKS
jgi:3-dehydroquinate dehydratase II